VNYSRVVFFSVGLFLLLVAISAIATLIVGAEESTQSKSFILTLYVLGFVASLLVYFYLGYKQKISPYRHAVLVASGVWFINLAVGGLLYIFLEIPIEPILFLVTALLNVIAVLLGTLFGIKLRHYREFGINAI
jgi:hypothetical protein